MQTSIYQLYIKCINIHDILTKHKWTTYLNKQKMIFLSKKYKRDLPE